MTARSGETIFALSSGQPPCAIAIIRLSGPDAFRAAKIVTGRSLPLPRLAALRTFSDPQTGELIDEGLLLCFPAESSVTGETLVELHCHGSRAVVRDLQAALSTIDGLRSADAGDFTRRAFANGRMDLSGVEGLGDLLTAETAMQRRSALAMMGGALSNRIEGWTLTLRRLAARIEAVLDFSDEGDVDESGLRTDVKQGMLGVAREIDADLAKPGAERLKDGVHAVIAGPPNAGKSTLLNVLVGREAAIVSPIAGTTRDIIEVPVSLGGIAYLFADTAGLRDESDDQIERIGIERATALLKNADIILWLGDHRDCPDVSGHILHIEAKADLTASSNSKSISISAQTGQGMDHLVDVIGEVAAALLPRPGEYALSMRQRSVMVRVRDALIESETLTDEILIGESLRMALSALDELTGRATTESVLDELFSGFCIGK
jgi:tRNA modification GTPase